MDKNTLQTKFDAINAEQNQLRQQLSQVSVAIAQNDGKLLLLQEQFVAMESEEKAVAPATPAPEATPEVAPTDQTK